MIYEEYILTMFYYNNIFIINKNKKMPYPNDMAS